ncbi:MAG: hypothetical protein AAFV86_18915 [Pseudomonadota bacterium]
MVAGAQGGRMEARADGSRPGMRSALVALGVVLALGGMSAEAQGRDGLDAGGTADLLSGQIDPEAVADRPGLLRCHALFAVFRGDPATVGPRQIVMRALAGMDGLGVEGDAVRSFRDVLVETQPYVDAYVARLASGEVGARAVMADMTPCQGLVATLWERAR